MSIATDPEFFETVHGAPGGPPAAADSKSSHTIVPAGHDAPPNPEESATDESTNLALAASEPRIGPPVPASAPGGPVSGASPGGASKPAPASVGRRADPPLLEDELIVGPADELIADPVDELLAGPAEELIPAPPDALSPTRATPASSGAARLLEVHARSAKAATLRPIGAGGVLRRGEVLILIRRSF
ncbi:MAG: hypothetical protein JOZ69_22245, partial [Myxococcales bacterium]|nr:hypothetical protein [Myxococcales bacterium]